MCGHLIMGSRWYLNSIIIFINTTQLVVNSPMLMFIFSIVKGIWYYGITMCYYRMYGFLMSHTHCLKTMTNISTNVPIVSSAFDSSYMLVVAVLSISLTKYCGH